MKHEATSPYAGDDSRWQAVLTRDAAADGAFYVAVRSTGIYCRPVCPARRPKREQVSFFDTAEAARGAGYRACRRCHPDEAGAQQRLVEDVKRIIETAEESLTLSDLAAQVSISPFHLQRLFKRHTGLTPRQYTAALRADRLKLDLRRGLSVTEAMFEAGYGSSRGLYENARRDLGMLPSTYRHGGRGERIAYGIKKCRLGHVLVAATEYGVCFVALGDGPEVLDDLRAELPNATLVDDGSTVAPYLDAVDAALDGVPAADVPLDARGSAFQQRVWTAIRAIPAGQTRSYSEIARSIGAPAAVRAVAGACAANPVAVLTPCHRVVRKDGGAGGYRWGAAKKQALLEAEQVKKGTAG
jgi:AraC family transcriptional regulator of adaptative response/methylated-DNA-[protein]-cysteine methyltransferase